MAGDERQGRIGARAWPRWAGWGAAAVGAALVAAMAILHTPPVRRLVLQQIVATLANRVGLVVRADTLRYNLLALRVRLDHVTVGAVGSEAAPFLTADRIELDFRRAVLAGIFALERVHLDNARVAVVAREDGTTNLPVARAGAGEPTAIPIGRIDIPRLAVSVRHEPQRLHIALPAVSVEVGPSEGHVWLLEAGRIERAGTSIVITGGGVVRFDGRALHLSRFTIGAPDLQVEVDGSLAVVARDTTADLHVRSEARLPGALRLVAGDLPVSGLAGLDGTIGGTLASPTTAIRVRSDALTVRETGLSRLEAHLFLEAGRLRLEQLEADVAGGRVTASATYATNDGATTATVSWEDVDVDVLLADWSVRRPRLNARATGTAAIARQANGSDGWAVDSRVRITPFAGRARRLPIDGAARFRSAGEQWFLEWDAVVGRIPLRARLGGRADADRPLRSRVSGTIESAGASVDDLIGMLRLVGLVDVPGDPRGGRFTARAELTGTLEAPHFRLAADAQDVTAAGIPGISAEIAAEGTPARVALDARLRQHSANTAAIRATVWPARGRIDAQVLGGIADFEALVPSLPVWGVAGFQLEATGLWRTVTVNGRATIAEARYDRVPLGVIQAVFRATPSAADVEVEIPDLAARGTVALVPGAPRRVTFDVEVTDAALEHLVQGITTAIPLGGRVSLLAHGDVPLADWRAGRAVVDVTALEATVGALPVRLIDRGRVSYGGRVLDVAGIDLRLGDVLVSVEGKLPVDPSALPVPAAEALRAVAVGRVEEGLAAVRALGLTDLPPAAADGQVALTARAGGWAERLLLEAVLDVRSDTLAVGTLPPFERLELQAHVGPNGIDRLSASGRWQGSRFDVSGRAPFGAIREALPDVLADRLPDASGAAVLDARLEAITPRVLEPFLPADALAQIDGTIDASVRVEAPSLDPAVLQGEVRIERLDLRLAGLPIAQREPTRIVLSGGRASVAAWNWGGQGATVAVQGDVGLADRQARLRAGGTVDLRILTPFVRSTGLSLAGSIMPRVAVTGRIDKPVIDGEVSLAAGEVRLRDPRLVATDLSAFVVLSAEAARVAALSGVVNGGMLRGDGELRYARGEPASLSLRTRIEGMGLEAPRGLQSELDADLTLRGRTDPPVGLRGTLSGEIRVARSAYREPVAVVTGLLRAMRAERLALREGSLASRLALDVRVVTDGDVVVDNNLARLELGGDLRVVGTLAAPLLSGRATLREGGQLFLGRNVYTIEAGTIDFIDARTIAPELSVEATTRAGGHDIELRVDGTPEDLQVTLRSRTEPELGQADVASLLLTGRRLDEVSGAEAAIVREQVVGYLSGDLLGIAGRALGFDTLRLGGADSLDVRRDPTAIAGAADPTSRLTFGRSIGRHLDITYSQSLRDGDAQTWIVDYQPVPQINVRLVSRDDTLRSYEFRHDIALGTDPRPGRRETRPEPPKVVGVVVTGGDDVVPTAQLQSQLELEVGDRFDFAAWQRDRHRLERALWSAGRLEARVAASRTDREGGVVLEYTIQAGPPTAIAVSGYPLDREARRRIEEAWAQAVIDEFLEDEVRAIVTEALAAGGYLHPSIEVELRPGAVKTLIVRIDPGPRTSGWRVEFEGIDDDAARELEAWSRTALKPWTAAEEVEEAIETELRARGHLAARVEVGTPRVEGDVMVLPVRVAGGPVFTIAGVRVTGAERLDADRVRREIGLEPGARYDPAAIAASAERVTALYRREGFVAARVAVEPIAPEGGGQAVVLAFTIEEGSRQVLRDLVISGNRSIDRDVIARALAVELGDALASDAWLQARARLFDTGLFRRVDVTAEPVAEPPPGTPAGERPSRWRVVVEEWPSLRIRYGVQVAEVRPEGEVDGRDLAPGLSADLTRRTLFGRAITVGGALEYQRRERGGRVFLNAPTVFGARIASLFTAERSVREFADAALTSERSGLAWEQRARLWRSLQLSYAYRFERNHTFETNPPPHSFLPPFDVTVNVARLTASAVLDTRDDVAETTRGLLLSSNLEIAPQALGSDIGFLRHVGQAYYFRPWRGLVFGSAARLGLVAPHAGQELIPSELFFGGGARTVRGVGQDRLGPRDVFGDPAGGRALLVFNQEVRFPIYRWIRGVGFVDAGNVFARPADISLAGLTASSGIGVRITTPFALLRADYARLWTNPSGVRPSRWTFGIGHTF
jgi:outer membrane protein assembly factor BamA